MKKQLTRNMFLHPIASESVVVKRATRPGPANSATHLENWTVASTKWAYCLKRSPLRIYTFT